MMARRPLLCDWQPDGRGYYRCSRCGCGSPSAFTTTIACSWSGDPRLEVLADLLIELGLENRAPVVAVTARYR